MWPISKKTMCLCVGQAKWLIFFMYYISFKVNHLPNFQCKLKASHFQFEPKQPKKQKLCNNCIYALSQTIEIVHIIRFTSCQFKCMHICMTIVILPRRYCCCIIWFFSSFQFEHFYFCFVLFCIFFLFVSNPSFIQS